MRPYLFISGCPRSGTTLLDKLVSSHPDAVALSQPLPLLYVEMKRWFLESCGREPGAFPLNDMFAENYYPPDDLVAFLRAQPVPSDTLEAVLAAMVSFDGQYTKPSDPLKLLVTYRPLPLDELIYEYTQLHAAPGASIIGSKETYAEEFVPYLLGSGARIICIVRDPRDVIASLDFGRGRHYAGRPKPLLFNVRQWRKSAAIALAHRHRDDFLLLRYEDVVTDTRACLDRIAGFLELPPFPATSVTRGLQDQEGKPWISNSSHAPSPTVTSSAIGRFRKLLPPGERRFIEATCLPEMKSFGYGSSLTADEVEPALRSHRERRALERAALAPYQWSADRRDEELERWRCLAEGRLRPELFMFEEAWRSLRDARSIFLEHVS